jgi:hypothetical protein
MTGILQTGDGGHSVTDKNVTLSYDYDQRMVGMNMYQSDSTSDLVASAGYTYDDDSNVTDLTYTTGTDDSGTTLAAYHWDYTANGLASDEYSYADSGDLDIPLVSDYTTWAQTSYGYDDDNELTSTSYTNFASAPSTNLSESYDRVLSASVYESFFGLWYRRL